MKLRNVNVIIFLLIILNFVFISGCAGIVKPITLQIHSGVYLNPNIDGQAEPVVIKLVQLKRSNTFYQDNYAKLMSKNYSNLNKNVLSEKIFEIKPGKSRFYKISIAKKAKYLGVIVGYRNLKQMKWRELIKISEVARDRDLQMFLTIDGIKIISIPNGIQNANITKPSVIA